METSCITKTAFWLQRAESRRFDSHILTIPKAILQHLKFIS